MDINKEPPRDFLSRSKIAPHMMSDARRLLKEFERLRDLVEGFLDKIEQPRVAENVFARDTRQGAERIQQIFEKVLESSLSSIYRAGRAEQDDLSEIAEELRLKQDENVPLLRSHIRRLERRLDHLCGFYREEFYSLEQRVLSLELQIAHVAHKYLRGEK